MKKKDQIICGLDVGTTKICMMIARVGAEGGLELVGTGWAGSSGLKKGLVVDLEEAATSIRLAAEEAESKTGLSVDWVTVGVSGDHIQSYNCHGAVSIEGKHHEVTKQDMVQVIHAAQSIPVPPEREIIHVLPQEFFLDNRGDIQNPVGLTGSRLDANIHVVTCDAALNQNLINAVNRAEMRVHRVILQQLASAEAVLTTDEKELGVAVIDIGGGTTDIAIFCRNSVWFSSVIPVGGLHFTRDLAVGLRTPLEDAERIKKEAGTVLPEEVANDEVIEVPGIGTRGTRSLQRKMVCEILRERGRELLELIRDQLQRRDEAGGQRVAGIVLTGGGSMLEGMHELAGQILALPVRHGIPAGIRGLTDELAHPMYAASVGLTILGFQGNGDFKRISDRMGSTPSWSLGRLFSWVSS